MKRGRPAGYVCSAETRARISAGCKAALARLATQARLRRRSSCWTNEMRAELVMLLFSGASITLCAERIGVCWQTCAREAARMRLFVPRSERACQ